MTRTIAIGMLKQGNTGSEIMQILDVIVNDIVEENNTVLQKLNDAISAQSWALRITLRAGYSALFEYITVLFVRQQQLLLLWGGRYKKQWEPNLQRWQFDFDITLRKKISEGINRPSEVAYIIRRWVLESIQKFSAVKMVL